MDKLGSWVRHITAKGQDAEWGFFPAQMMIIRDLILKCDVTFEQKLMC